MNQIPEGATHLRGDDPTIEGNYYYRKFGAIWQVFHPHAGKWLKSCQSAEAIEQEIEEGAIREIPKLIDAPQILMEGYNCIADRASERDTDAERSMAATVKAFNAIYGTELTETQGWQFMALLKMVRARGGDLRMDDYIDQAAYAALAGEAAQREQNE